MVRATLTHNGAVWVGELLVPVRIEKTIEVRAGRSEIVASYQVTNTDDVPVSVRFGVELNWGVDGGDSPHSYLVVDGERTALSEFSGHDRVSSYAVGSTLPNTAGEVTLHLRRPASLWRFPLESVSNSEAGYERVYQGTCTLLWWDALLEPGRPWEAELTISLKKLER